MNSENSSRHPSRNTKLRDALSILNDVDHFRNLHVGAVVLIFFATSGLSVWAFYWIIEMGIWLGLDDINPLMPVSISYILIFVVWVLVFLAVLSALNAVGVKDIRSAARTRLSDLAIDTDELSDLRTAMAARNWKHSNILKNAVASLANGQRANCHENSMPPLMSTQAPVMKAD